MINIYKMKNSTFYDNFKRFVLLFCLSLIWLLLVIIFSYPWLIGYILSDKHSFLESIIVSARDERIFLVNFALCAFFCYDMFSHQVQNKMEKNIFKPLFFCVCALVISCLLFIITLDEVSIIPILKSNKALYFLWVVLLAYFFIMKFFGFMYAYPETTEDIKILSQLDENIKNEINILIKRD